MNRSKFATPLIFALTFAACSTPQSVENFQQSKILVEPRTVDINPSDLTINFNAIPSPMAQSIVNLGHFNGADPLTYLYTSTDGILDSEGETSQEAYHILGDISVAVIDYVTQSEKIVNTGQYSFVISVFNPEKNIIEYHLIKIDDDEQAIDEGIILYPEQILK